MAVDPIPEGYHAVTPFVIVSDADRFLRFMHEAFGAEEIARVVGEDGAIGHAESRIVDSVVMCFDGKPDWPPTPAFLRLYVEDADATYQQALDAGGTSVTRPTDMPWGDRVLACSRPAAATCGGSRRAIEDVDEEEMNRRWTEKEWIERMEYVQGAEFFPGR